MAEFINGKEVFAKDFFTYNVVFTTMAQNTSQTKNFTIQADSDFAWQKAMFFVDISGAASQTAATRVLADATVLIVDTGSGRQLMDQAVSLTSLFGTAENPFILTQPKIFSARSNITVTVNNTEQSAVTYASLHLAFVGTKIFYKT